MVISPLSFCEFFEIHGSKFKPYPIRDLGEAAVGGITHSVFFFRIRKDPFNGFFALLVKVGILGSVSCVIGKLLVIFPKYAFVRPLRNLWNVCKDVLSGSSYMFRDCSCILCIRLGWSYCM